MQLSWEAMISKHQAVRTDINRKYNLPTPKEAWDKGAAAIWFETTNFGWIVLAQPENGQRIFKY